MRESVAYKATSFPPPPPPPPITTATNSIYQVKPIILYNHKNTQEKAETRETRENELKKHKSIISRNDLASL